MYCYSEAGFEAVEGCPVVSVLISALAEEQGMVIEEEMSLHGFEPGQLLHSHRCPLMADPHTEAALHHHTAQLAEVALSQTYRWTDTQSNILTYTFVILYIDIKMFKMFKVQTTLYLSI